MTINGGSEQAAQGDTVRSFFTRQPTVNTSATPSMTIPEGDDQTVDNKTLQVSQIASVRIPWTGEDIKHVNNGSGFETIYGDQVRQAMRGIVNTIEARKSFGGIEAGRDVLNVFGSSPIMDGDTLIGVADVGAPFGKNFVESIKSRFGVDIAIHQLDGQSAKTLASTLATNAADPGTN